MAAGRLGGEFFIPQSIVRLIVEVIEPFHGKVFDPACGSGGMFVQCAKFVGRHSGSPTRDLSVYGQEQKEVTVPIGKMNLALNGLLAERLGTTPVNVPLDPAEIVATVRDLAGPGAGCWAEPRPNRSAHLTRAERHRHRPVEPRRLADRRLRSVHMARQPRRPERVRQRRALTSARRDVRLASDPRGHGRLAL